MSFQGCRTSRTREGVRSDRDDAECWLMRGRSRRYAVSTSIVDIQEQKRYVGKNDVIFTFSYK